MKCQYASTSRSALLVAMSLLMVGSIGPSRAASLPATSFVLAPTAVEDIEFDSSAVQTSVQENKGGQTNMGDGSVRGLTDGSVRSFNGDGKSADPPGGKTADGALLPAVRAADPPGENNSLNFTNNGNNPADGNGAPNGLIGLLRTGGDTKGNNTSNGGSVTPNLLNFANQLNAGITDGTSKGAPGAANASLNFTNAASLNFTNQARGTGGASTGGFTGGVFTGGANALNLGGHAVTGGGGAGADLHPGAGNASLNFTRGAVAPLNLNVGPALNLAK